MKEQSISIHEAHRLELTTGKFIIGIKNGVAMVKYPNKQKFRAEAAADGFPWMKFKQICFGKKQ